MMKSTYRKRSSFTLVELLVAMGVFSILMLVSVQIFSGAQKLWVSSEQKNSAFAAARTAMEFVAARIQANSYSEETPFLIYDQQGSTHYKKIYFPTSMAMNRKDSAGNDRDDFALRFIGFEVNSAGVLEMRVYSDEKNKKFASLFPPYVANRRRSGGYKNYSDACTQIKTRLDNAADYNKIEVVENVTGFKLIPYNISGSGKKEKISKSIAASDHKTPPYLLEIELSLIDSSANYKRWTEADADGKHEIEREFGYTFRRAVLLGDRRNR